MREPTFPSKLESAREIPEIRPEEHIERERDFKEIIQEIPGELTALFELAEKQSWPPQRFLDEVWNSEQLFIKTYEDPPEPVQDGIKSLFGIPPLLWHHFSWEAYDARRRKQRGRVPVPTEQKRHLDALVKWQQYVANFLLAHRGITRAESTIHNDFYSLIQNITAASEECL